MTSNHTETIEINLPLIRRLMNNWPKRASVRGCYFDEFKANDGYDPALPDYPVELVPFRDHPAFDRLDDELKFKILTWGWMVYNTRTIHAEEKVVNPSFDLILGDTFEGTDNFEFRSVIQQSLIDERFHSYMHFNAMHITKALRNVTDKIAIPDSITYRLLLVHQDGEGERWKKDLMTLAAGIVSETSINAYLSLLSKCTTVQPKHALVSRLHDIDEYAHSSLLVEVAKSVFVALDRREKAFFTSYLPRAMDAFCAQDYAAWKNILLHYKVEGAEELIGDCQREKAKEKLVNDYTGLKKIAEELNILKDLEYEFN